MFQTLGNLAVDPRVGLLFVDWDTGTTLQLTGRADIVWAGDLRGIVVAIEAVHERDRALRERWA
jgi:uncharacterized protein